MELSAIIPALCENNCPICPRLSNIAKLISKYCRYAAKSLHFAAVASSSNNNKMHAIIIQQQQKPHSYSTIALSFCWSLPKHKAQGARRKAFAVQPKFVYSINDGEITTTKRKEKIFFVSFSCRFFANDLLMRRADELQP
ncbi:uncharacterized protein LOC129248569 [Anastrepha obliqua]|uniref:uncharacterized protein LOC129248569 n=1 Tax=Anastrepha obliqua TaxID=95512 RepID=UPI00240A9497|nr:uncharacterized protein LOC129248569 [Anastrepha obliqua]